MGIYIQPLEDYLMLLIKLTIPKFKDNWGSEYPTDVIIAKYAELDRIVLEIILNRSNTSNVLTMHTSIVTVLRKNTLNVPPNR